MKTSYFSYAILLQLLNVFTFRSCSLVYESKECNAWRQIEQNLEASNDGHNIKCEIISSCTGLNCTGVYKSYDFNASLEIQPCSNPIGIIIAVDIPKLGIHQGIYHITSNETISTPEVNLPFVGKVGAYIDATYRKDGDFVEFQLSARPKEIEGITVMPPLSIIQDLQIPIPSCQNGKAVTHSPDVPSHTNKQSIITSGAKASGSITIAASPVISTVSTTIKAGQASSTPQQTKPCEIGNLTSCGQHETCVQESIASLKGHCECNSGFHLDANDICVQVSSVTEASTSTAGSLPAQAAANTDPSNPSGESNSTKMAIIGVMVPLAFVTLSGAVVYFVLKRLRIQRGSMAQDHPLIGQNEEGDAASDSIM